MHEDENIEAWRAPAAGSPRGPEAQICVVMHFQARGSAGGWLTENLGGLTEMRRHEHMVVEMRSGSTPTHLKAALATPTHRLIVKSRHCYGQQVGS